MARAGRGIVACARATTTCSSVMQSPKTSDRRALQDKTFLWLLVAVTLAFGWILWPFYGAVFWATVLAILFTPLYRRLSERLRQRRTLAALATLVIILVI